MGKMSYSPGTKKFIVAMNKMQKVDLNKYNTIFFDLYHTLTYPGITSYKTYEWDIFNVTEEFWTHHATKTYYHRGIGKISMPEKIIESILLSANLPIDETKVKEATAVRIEKFTDCLINVNKNIINTVRHLFNLNKQLCLISNSDVIDKRGWDLSPLKDYFKCAIFAPSLRPGFAAQLGVGQQYDQSFRSEKTTR